MHSNSLIVAQEGTMKTNVATCLGNNNNNNDNNNKNNNLFGISP